jgi:hypothetical protein
MPPGIGMPERRTTASPTSQNANTNAPADNDRELMRRH